MKLPLKLSLSRSHSPSSSTPSSPSPCGTPSTSPTSFQKKLRIPLPNFNSSKRKTKLPDAGAGRTEITSETLASASSSPRVVSISRRERGKGKSHSDQASPSSSFAMAASPSAAVQDEISEMQEVFAQFDANGDGKISTEELQAVLESLGDETTREEAALMMREVDADGDGFIDLQEFVEMNKRCLAGATVEEEEEMAATFAIFDLEKKGWITAEGLQQVLQRLGGSLAQRASVEDCRRMIRGVDRKGVGHVDFDDFKRMMTPLIF